MDDGRPPLKAALDRESGLDRSDGIELRVWLRLLTCCNLISGEIRSRLASEFETTLPRFDVLAQLDRAGEPLSMGALSQRMMVTNGNITGLIDRLEREGLVERRPAPTDRRMQLVALTDDGSAFFARAAQRHRAWVDEMTAGLDGRDLEALHGLLGRLKESVQTAGRTRAEDEA